MRALVVSDLHVGSLVGLSPPEVEVSFDNDDERVVSHTANRIQLAIYKRWEEMCSSIEEQGGVDILICNGDACDGHNRKAMGLETWTTSTSAQAEVAANLLGMVRAKRCICTQGSAYHVLDNGSMDEYVAKLLPHGRFHNEFVLTSNGKRVHFKHTVGGSAIDSYRTTPIARELMQCVINEKEYGHFDGIVRSHVHYHVYAGTSSSFGLTTPCWKGRDRYGSKNMGWVPKLGYVVIEEEGGELSWYAKTFTLKGRQLMPEVKV